MKTKKTFVSAAVSLALLINFPQVSADEVETFGSDFEDNISEVVPFQDDDEDEDLGPVLIFNDPSNASKEKPSNSKKQSKKEKKRDTEKQTDTEEQPDDENSFFRENPPVEEEPPVTEIFPAVEVPSENDSIIIEPTKQYPERERILPPSKLEKRTNNTKTQKKLKTQKPRFIKLAMDDTYTYYLDKQSVAWRRIPYSASEYMLDVWVRMIENNPDTSDLPEDMSEYINSKSQGEIEVAAERGIAFAPVDIEVLQNKKFFLEHYYLRPKNQQIQFLCELEVVGHPQNTISEREYNYKNWENLIPGSVESMIYNQTMKEVGKSGNSEHGRMSFADMLEEYARISIR